MQRVAAQLSHRLTFVPTQNFCAITRDSVSNPIKERIMSTPSWPVPYYQRLHKAYPVRGRQHVTQNKRKSTSLSTTSMPTTPTGIWPRIT